MTIYPSGVYHNRGGNDMKECCVRTTKRADEDKNAIISRLNRIAGQVQGVKRMIEDDKYCDDVLIQLSAINKSIKSLANLILEKHMYSCVLTNIQNGNTDILSEVANLFKRFQ